MARPQFNNIKNKNNATRKIRIAGNVRQSQLITTYGIGSIVDFVNDTVIIAGVDDWDIGKNEEGAETRRIYCENLQSLTGVKYFISPKTETSSGWVKSKDIASYPFPEMLYCPKCKRFVTAKEAANANPKHPNKCCLSVKKNIDSCKKDSCQCPTVICTGTLVASRFVVACENGHIEDFPYSWWIHGNSGCLSDKPPRIRMYNIGNRSDIESLWIKCENCGTAKPMANAFGEAVFAGENGYPCRGNHPHLKNKRRDNEQECTERLKTRLRSSSSIYYPVTVSALQIPPWSRFAVKFIERKYNELVEMANVASYLSKNAPSGITLEQLLTAWNLVRQRKGSSSPRIEEDIYQDEYRILVQDETSDDEGDYSAFSVKPPRAFKSFIEKITVVDKLTVIEALKGFTRLKSWNGDDASLAPLSARPKDWLPAVQLRGEGVFFQFSEEIIERWKGVAGNRYLKMAEQLSDSYLKKIRGNRFLPDYVLLHTFSHLFIRQVANECGYSAASIKEKIYSPFKSARESAYSMYGILVYLASSDSDGSLGGLISIAQSEDRLHSILENMLRKAQWCSADPLCMTSTEQGAYSLNYSACHDCALLPETSCESQNALLDRVAVVGKPEEPQLGLFGELLLGL